jgi:hypothetical protein
LICLKLYNLKGYLEIFGNKEIVVTDDGINPEGISPSLADCGFDISHVPSASLGQDAALSFVVIGRGQEAENN